MALNLTVSSIKTKGLRAECSVCAARIPVKRLLNGRAIQLSDVRGKYTYDGGVGMVLPLLVGDWNPVRRLQETELERPAGGPCAAEQRHMCIAARRPHERPYERAYERCERAGWRIVKSLIQGQKESKLQLFMGWRAKKCALVRSHAQYSASRD